MAQHFRRQPPPPPPNSPVEPENPIQPPLPLPNPQLQQNNRDFAMLVIAFCLAVATEIAFRSLQNLTIYPITFHLLCLMIMLSFASIFVAKYISPTKPDAACVLENVGVFFGVTAFFIAVTISSPLWLGIISGIIYAVSLVAIIICNCPPPLFPL